MVSLWYIRVAGISNFANIPNIVQISEMKLDDCGCFVKTFN